MPASLTSRFQTSAIVAMDTTVAIRYAVQAMAPAQADAQVERAFAWFRGVEQVCSRFDRGSELFRLCQRSNTPVRVSKLLFEAVRIATRVAASTGGLFDPTIGQTLARRGFDRNYVTGEHVSLGNALDFATYQDVLLDERNQTIELEKPLLLDLGAVAKGLAADLAARELSGFSAYSIDAGGDILVHGPNEQGEPWRVGIAHPREAYSTIARINVTDAAVCTSGDYERRQPGSPRQHHLLNAHSGASVRDVVSCTVIAPTATVADALSTAAFVSGSEAGLRLLAREEVDGLFVLPDLSTVMTPGFERWLA